VFYGNDSKIQEAADGIIKEAVLNPGEETAGDFLWNESINGQCVVYEFDIAIPLSEYFSSIGVKKKNIPENMSSFSDIVIVLPANSTDSTSVSFVDTSGETDMAISYTTDYSPRLLQMIAENEEGTESISTALSGFNIFSDNIFVTRFDFDVNAFKSIKSYKNINAETSDKEYLAEKTKQYFDGYSSKSHSFDSAGTYTISDNNNVVKCHSNGVTEYFNYKGVKDEGQNLSSAYMACLEFIERDTSVKCGYYLKNVKITGEGVVFGFDYCVDNKPVVISDEIKEKCGIEYGIEVVCSANTVRKYKKYDYSFDVSEKNDIMPAVDFLTAVNFAMGFDGREDIKIDNICLGYYEKSGGENALCWFVEIGDEQYIIDSEKGNIVLD